MTTETTQATEQAPSPESTRDLEREMLEAAYRLGKLKQVQVQEFREKEHPKSICQKCNETRRIYKDGLCLGCYGLSIAEKAAWSDGKQVWIECPECRLEWSKLKENGICFDCDQKKYDALVKAKKLEERMIKIFGSIKTMNYYTFDKFKVTYYNEDAFKACREFNTKTQNLYLFGTCGVGKSHLAYATAKMYALNGKSVIITTPLKMVDSFRTKNDAEKEDRFEEFTESELLLIDDLGISKYTDFAMEVLCEILNRRTLQMRNGLMVTTNLSLDKLTEKMKDDRLSSRLAGLCQVVSIGGPDYRVVK